MNRHACIARTQHHASDHTADTARPGSARGLLAERTAPPPLVDALIARGDHTEAITRLEQVQRRQDACPYDELDANGYWLRSDLSLAYLKAGREQDCLVLLGRLIDNPASPLDVQHHLEQDDHLQHALRTNQRLCHTAHERRLERYRATPCPQPVENALDSIAVPSGNCLALQPATEARTCPRLEEWRDGRRLRQWLSRQTTRTARWSIPRAAAASGTCSWPRTAIS